jgi:5-methylcytosine-specific restriction endonuclease McrA
MSKQIIVNLEPPKKKSKDEVPTKPPPKKRVITEDQRWKFSEEELAPEYGARIIGILHEGSQNQDDHCKLVRQQIINKLGGYRQQDLEKELFDPEEFIGFSKVLETMMACELKCHYCLEPVKILYEYVRDPKQWTLDRIDNDLGHNRDNVWIACLSCNLRRRTMRPDRYEFTKQMVITKQS